MDILKWCIEQRFRNEFRLSNDQDTERNLANGSTGRCPDADTVAEAQIVTAEEKILSTEIAIAATNMLFELAGTRSTLAEHNLDRHWRDVRTHTLHDPVRWNYAILGKYLPNGEKPPLHAWS
ncbi:acyl-CoA dehydrogenase family protein (plasmid) [Rhizobium sp. CCGE 510]|nr:acyl-CoA dehydrogenase family protein [Rhizobium sp. CCGE 510]